MAVTIDDFSKIWASTSPLTPYEFSENNYKQGWNFVGGTPPSRQMWDFLQKNNDEKMQYLANNYIPLSGGTLTGNITLADGGNPLSTSGGTMSGAIEGNPLTLTADDGNGNSADLVLNADGTLTWNGKQFVANETVDISSGVSATVTSGNATIVDSYPKVYRFGKVVFLVFAINTTTTVSVGGNITGNISNIPDLTSDSYGVGYSGSSCGVFYINSSKNYGIRITGANLPTGYTFACSATYLMP